ncbi:hypothetical protein AB0I72_20005 [Nocardiopsis sp. NPDC049922]|uniref:hypothetical protein n=1 Tax=Nocardiopsis sp. NPDC049922 TaxID=3155157 RepID=UPI0034032D30
MVAFATPDEVRLFLDDEGLDDTRIQLVLDVIADEIRFAVGWSVTQETDVVAVVDGPGVTELLLPTLHLTAVASVVEDGVLLDPSGYLRYRHGVIKRVEVEGATPIRWTRRLQGITVTYTHGYPDAAVPGVFKAVTLDVVGRIADNPAGLVKSRTVNKVAVSYADVRALVGPIDDRRLDVWRLPDGGLA